MQKLSTLKRLLLLFTLLSLLLAVPVALAQEGEGEGEDPAAEEAGEGDVAPEDTVDEEAEAEVVEEEEVAVSPLAPLGINQGFLFAQIINFAIIAVILSLALWRPLTNMLDSRAEKIQKGLEDASAAAQARQNAEADAEKIRSEARTEAAKVVEDSRSRGEELARQIETEAREEADRIREDARLRANEERDRQLADLRGQVVEIAVAMSQRIINETLDDGRQQALVTDFFSNVPAEARQLEGKVEVISAMPLGDDEKNRVQNEIKSDDIEFRVDPSILGGLVIRSEERVVDASVRSSLNELSGRLR